MIEFSKLANGAFFDIYFWELKPLNNDELKKEYSLKMFQEGYKKCISIRKENEDTCTLYPANLIFKKAGNMFYNEESGLYFLGNFVNNDSRNEHVSNELLNSYINDSIELNKKEHTLVLK